MIRLMENTKKCTKCGRELPLDQFHKRRYKSGKEGRQSYCKYCKRELGAVRYQNNRAEIGLTTAKWAKNNPKKVVAKVVRWQKRNPDKVRAGNARYQKERKVSDLGYKIAGNTRAAMSSALSGSKKCTHTTGLLGCSIEYLRNYLESLFQPRLAYRSRNSVIPF